MGGKSRDKEASSALSAQFDELQHVYVNNRAHVSSNFSSHFDAITEGIQLLAVQREIVRRNKDGLSSKNRQRAAEMEQNADDQLTSLLEMTAKGIEILLADNRVD